MKKLFLLLVMFLAISTTIVIVAQPITTTSTTVADTVLATDTVVTKESNCSKLIAYLSITDTCVSYKEKIIAIMFMLVIIMMLFPPN